jgi:hypothetical protein
MIAPFQCNSCNAALAVVDAATLVCPFCGTINRIPEKYREELRLTRDLDEATRASIVEWSRLNQINVPRWWFVFVACLPFALMTVGLAAILSLGLASSDSRSALPVLIGLWVWLPLIPAQALAASVSMKSILVSGAAQVGVAFAARPPLAPGAPPNCRQCGAPLSLRPDDILVRCIYCQAESIVSLDQLAMQSLQARASAARGSLAQAMAALATRAGVAKVETVGRTLIVLGFLILPLVWSFVASVRTSYWSLLIALDVWVVGVCLFWYAREAFLPKVTIEELDAIINSRSDEPEVDSSKAKPLASTRGWYDHASEKRNFAIPAIVALMFLVIELMVLSPDLPTQ